MEITASTVGKGIVAIGGSGAGGYGIYSLAAGRATRASELSDQQTTQDTSSEVSTPAVPNFLFQVAGFGGETGDYSKDGGSFGYAFGRFMLNPKENDSLWKSKEESYGSGYSREKCEETYKKKKTDVIGDSNGLLGYVWQFCSVAQVAPYTIKSLNDTNVDQYNDTWAGLGSNPDALFDISGAGSGNNDEHAWEHIYKNVLKVDRENNAKKNSIDSIFKAMNSGEDLSNACKEAYESKATDTVTNYGKNVISYCVLDASIALTQYPTPPSK